VERGNQIDKQCNFITKITYLRTIREREREREKTCLFQVWLEVIFIALYSRGKKVRSMSTDIQNLASYGELASYLPSSSFRRLVAAAQI
jgi:hypothetical protein